MVKILLIGSGAREHVIAETLKKNKEAVLYSYLKSKNPGITSLSHDFKIGSYNELEKIKSYAEEVMPDFAFIGPEEPLANGVVDLLNGMGIGTVGPSKSLARLETSKAFTRSLLKKHKINGNPEFRVFTKENIGEAKRFIDGMEQCVLKPDGLTGGKGVKVQGEHFKTKNEAFEYCNEILQTHPAVIIEERLDGEEFSLQCLTDGKTVAAMPPVQDHKRAYADDKGPNCGGMGSYSCEDHLLPFLTKSDIHKGVIITQKVADALFKETGEYYKGVMYAGLIATKKGVRLLEYNARFGDPEAMNVLPLMETGLVDVCNAIINTELHKIKIRLQNKATVCKYVVPEGYPDNPLKNQKIKIEKEKVHENGKVYYASVEQKKDGLYTTGSRAIACLGVAENPDKAERIAEGLANSVKGRLFHRRDIGTSKLIGKRIEHMRRLTK